MAHNHSQAPGPGKSGGARAENNRIYAHPIPLLFTDDSGFIPSLNSLIGLSVTRISNPYCEGVFDAATRSVWVTNSRDSMILWRRGFFGKGDLSRSEPSWLARQVNARRAGGQQITSEEITAKRRAERKQFKLDRARAIAAAAAEAEAAFAEGRVVAPPSEGAIPSAATWRPPPKVVEVPPGVVGEQDEPLEDLEHLQLTLQEAWFLVWGFDCLTVLDPGSQQPMTLQQIWAAFQTAHISDPWKDITQYPPALDSPFLVNYVVYHHFRSLGWVVKGGLKFCVDYLLYKRGPVFHHAEFAVVVCPVYEDPKDQESSRWNLENALPFTWSWLSTINRVNSQVQKTLVLVYVTIPRRSRVCPDVLSSPACLVYYSVREVILRRFVPARMRD